MKLLVFSTFIFFLNIFPTAAQEIRGKVLHETGNAAVNVHVSFRNKVNSVQTKADGSFVIVAKKLPDTLVFSAPGVETYTVVVTEKTLKDPNFEVVLLDARKNLSEVVVAAHGARKKSLIRSEKRIGTTPDAAPVERSMDLAAVEFRDHVYSRTGPADGGMNRIYQGRKMFMYDSINVKNDTIVYRTHLLTAGEVNDFNKWKMWEDFGETEFKVWSNHWKMFARRRYCVQLQNRQKQALISQPVYLVDAGTKDTVWRTYTDNTGKAELWGSFHSDNTAERQWVIACKDYPPLKASVPFENGVNHYEINISCSFSNEVQIAFVVDATGSMGDEIEFLKLELEDVIRQSFEEHKDLDLKVGSVFYRDRADEYLTKRIGFQTELLKVLNFIKLQKAGGGGDKPEAVHAALRDAVDSLEWNPNARSRILFLILDAPPHDEDKMEIIDLTVKAAAKGIRIVPVVCSGSDKSTEYLMRAMALATNGTYAFLTDHSGIGLPHEKPTTDAFSVELFNALLKRLISQMVFAGECGNAIVRADPKNIPGNILKVKVFPNPTQGDVTIDAGVRLKEVFITDFTGKILMRLQGNNRQDRWKTNIAGYPAGTYLVKYITEENQWGTEKVVLMH